MKITDLPKAYSPQEIEKSIYQTWEESGFFNPDNLPGERTEPFCISMPPPNVTGVLHLGHALENTIMDIEVRYQRMLGKKAVIIPGTDHAAVATQAKVEKLLIADGITNPRKELGREELLKRIRQYAEDSKATIIKQVKTMGTSCDWSRLAYTFDEQRSRVVNKVFTRMFNDGLIEKNYRTINWSVKGQSTCSDDELEYIDQASKLYTFKYSADFPMAISTTRPETKLGDTAVAVNPDDDRYKQYIGQTITVDVGAAKPLELQIIGDKAVDPEFGTGAVGVTPAHSMIDYDMYLEHSLKLIPVINEHGKMTEEAGAEYEGLTTLEARDKFVKWLESNSLMETVEDITHNVGISDRFKDVVEVIPKEQWFVNVNKEIPGKGKSLKDLMREAVTGGLNGDSEKSIKIIPSQFQKQFTNWIDKLRDWCISRQIWWGHRIPVWYCEDCNEISASENGMEVCPKCSSKKVTQDEDTLDTWFSSAMWTFSILGWPEETVDFKNFHPNAWLQMGYEILFFWMARMILMTTYVLDEVPFKEMYFHGMLRDKDGNKFSKSMGNGIDPLDVCEEYGTDALRLSLISGISPGNDSRFYNEKVEGARNFVNKLWNISRYILTSTDISNEDNGLSLETDADKWIITNLNTLISEVQVNLNEYNFSLAAEKLREFTRSYFADWYLETAKVEGNKDVILNYVLKTLLKLWHPFIPFVTEHIWKYYDKNSYMMVQYWPKLYELKIDNEAVDNFEKIKEIVTAIRSIRAEANIEPVKKLKVAIKTDNQDVIKNNQELIERLGRLESLEIINLNGDTPFKDFLSTVLPYGEVLVATEGIVDKEKEVEKINKEIQHLQKISENVQAKLNNQEFVSKAPEAIINKEKEKLVDYKNQLESLETKLELFK